MSDRQLPQRPDFDQLRRRAKELRDAARDGEMAALDRIRAYLPGRAPVNLAAAQVVLAREYGFASWPALKAEVVERLMDRDERVRAFLYGSVRGHFMPDGRFRADRAARLLADDPGIATRDIRIAAVLGDVEHVRRLVTRDPSATVRADAESGWPPLLFACNSRWHRMEPRRAPGIVEVARLLLDAGASPDTTSPEPLRCSALYAAAGLANHPALARLLLARGADPDAEAALYHTAFHHDLTCLRLLLDHGATAERQDTLAAAISVRNAGAVRVLLDAGADARLPLPAPAMGESYEPDPPVGASYAAVEFDCSTELLALLLDHGADPDGRGQTGWSVLRLAVRRGRTDLAGLLREHGARDDGAVVDRLLGACTAGDRPSAERLLAERTTLLDDVDAVELGDALTHAARRGGIDAVRLMLDLGVPIGLRGSDGSTALHNAAGAGSVELVRMLLDRGADLEARDDTFGGTPLSWATVGSGLSLGDDPRPDRVGTVRALLETGAATEGAWVPSKPPSPEVASVLAEHGVGPED